MNEWMHDKSVIYLFQTKYSNELIESHSLLAYDDNYISEIWSSCLVGNEIECKLSLWMFSDLYCLKYMNSINPKLNKLLHSNEFKVVKKSNTDEEH